MHTSKKFLMKKIQPFICIAFFLLSYQFVSAQQLNESFEGNTFPPPGWTTSNVMGSAAVWQSSMAEAHSGTKSAFINYENGAQGEDWLKTSQIFSIQSGDSISFWLKNQYTQPHPPDNIEVLVSTTNNQNASFTTTLANIDVTTLLSGNWARLSYSLSAFAAQNIYIAFRHTDNNGSGVFLDDVAAGSPIMNDAASRGIKVTPSAIVTPGASLAIVDTILNAGSNTLAAGIPVKYSVNNGAAITAGTTAASITPGTFTTVSFSYTAPSAGVYTIKVFSALASDIHAGNDTVTYILTVQQPITAFPVFEDFTNPLKWTYSGSAMWDIVAATNPAGSNNDNTARARFYINLPGKVFYLQSPLLNFSGIAKPMVDFYVAYRRLQNEDDKLEAVVSLDGGVTFQPAPLYSKSYTTGLSTVGYDPLQVEFSPSSAGDWRHEAVDLSAYANQPNILIALKATSAFGNDLYIDDINIINQNASLYTIATITAPGQIATGPFNTKVKFNSIGKVAGGIVKFQGSTSQPPAGGFAPNTTATSADGTISSPNFVFPQYQTITYTGNDSTRANYDISLDITGIPGVQNADKLYIVKRSDQTGLWVAFPTTRTGNILTATGFNKFSDFGIAYYTSTLPLSLISFNGKVNNGKVDLTWQTNNEKNIAGYDIERLINNTWTKIGFIPSAGNSATANNYSFDDNAPLNGINYYRLKIIDADSKPSYSRIINVTIDGGKFNVYQNTPNPFTNSTTIRYSVAEKSSVKIVVYNAAGSQLQVLTNETQDAGSYEIKWNALNISAGNYFYKVIIGDKVVIKKMLKL